MKLVHLPSIICVFFLGLSINLHADVNWMTDFEAAKARAKAEEKHMLINFTGSDWCAWCIKLDKEVFSKPAFKSYAEQDLVLVEIDFPRREQKQSQELKDQNEKLAMRYNVRGFPTILILSSDGSLIGRTGYESGGAEAYVAHIRKMLVK